MKSEHYCANFVVPHLGYQPEQNCSIKRGACPMQFADRSTEPSFHYNGLAVFLLVACSLISNRGCLICVMNSQYADKKQNERLDILQYFLFCCHTFSIWIPRYGKATLPLRNDTCVSGNECLCRAYCSQLCCTELN